MAESPSTKSVEVEKADSLQQCPDLEREVLEQQLKVSTVEVGYASLYRYATGKDIFVIIASSLSSIAAGAVLPLMTVSRGSCLECIDALLIILQDPLW
jgi:hypothetical protein